MTSPLLDALLGFALIAVIPLAFGLDRLTVRLRGVAAAAGCLATVGLALRRDIALAVALGTPWLVTTVVAALMAIRTWWRGRRTLASAARRLPFAYLAFGAGWLMFELAGVQPLKVAPPFVELAAVHMSYAGFTAGMLTTVAARRLVTSRPVPATVMLASVLASPPVVAVGFRFAPPLQVIGAVLLTLGLSMLAWLTVRIVLPATSDGLTATLLGISSAAIAMPMVLATWWAIGMTAALPAPSVPFMARSHGLTNAIGFAFLGVLGWRRLQHEQPDEPASELSRPTQPGPPPGRWTASGPSR